ncbi:hypothetical protein Fmac_004576 [Flemingia macrophylla]|uniref:ALOG domain-containing protein n=1 Tax=Flemingia macrophylla TaxID=520843 RepID=A0ABD1N5Z3_9FABA
MSAQIQNASSHSQASSSSSQQPLSNQQPLSRYESQKKRDWNTFGQYLKNQSPPVPLSQCNFNHVLDFLRYLDQFGKTKVHLYGCIFFGQPTPPAPCACPLRQAWGSLDALIGRLRAAYEEHGGSPETNPFGGGAIRVYLREVKECQAKARGIPYKKKKKKRNQIKGTQSAKDIQHQRQRGLEYALFVSLVTFSKWAIRVDWIEQIWHLEKRGKKHYLLCCLDQEIISDIFH